MNMWQFTERVAVTVLLILLSPEYAWAYIDPGIGSYFFQLAIAGVLAGMYTLRRYSATVIAFFRSRRQKHPDQSR